MLLLLLVMRALLAVVLFVATLGAGLPGAEALTPEERKRAIREELASIRESVDEVASAEVELIAALEVSRQRTAELDAVVAGLDEELVVVAGELHTAERQLAAADAHHRTVLAELSRTRAQLLESRHALRDQAVTAFIRAGKRPSALDLVLRADDVAQAQAVTVLADAVLRAQDDLVDETGALEEDAALLEVDAARAEAAAASQHQAVAVQQASLEAVRSEQAAARAEVAAEAEVEAQLLAGARAEKQAYQARASALEAESAAITELLRKRAAEQAERAARAGSGVLGYPVARPTVTSGYGYRTHPIYGGRRLHAGMDFRAPMGTPILASAAGTVVSAGYSGGYGNVVVIDHGRSLATLYAHQSRLAVSAGQQVSRGQTVGSAGSTGSSTGPHLHFEVRVDGTPVDPAAYL